MVALLSSAFAVWGFVSGAQGVAPFLVTAVACLIMATVIGAEFYRSHSLEEKLKPKLSIVFAPGDNPLYDSMHLNNTVRYIRVGIHNTGAESVENVGVMVTRLMPDQPGIFPMQLLEQTHQQPHPIGRFIVNSSNEPLMFVDLVSQSINNKGATDSLLIRFVDNVRSISTAEKQYMIWLTVDGVGSSNPVKIILRKNSSGQFDAQRALFP